MNELTLPAVTTGLARQNSWAGCTGSCASHRRHARAGPGAAGPGTGRGGAGAWTSSGYLAGRPGTARSRPLRLPDSAAGRGPHLPETPAPE